MTSSLLLLGAGRGGSTPPPSYIGLGDIVSIAPFYGVRAYTGAIAAAATRKLIKIRRSSDNATADILVATSGGLGVTANATSGSNGVSVSSWAGADNLFINIWYDQAGTDDVNQATAANQPQLLLNQTNGKPAIKFDGANSHLLSTATYNQAQPWTIISVINATTVTSNLFFFADNANGSALGADGGGLALLAGSNPNVTMSAGAFHSAIGVADGAGSELVVDGTATNLGAGPNDFGGGAGINVGCYTGGVLFWDGYVCETGLVPLGLNATQYGNVWANQSAYYGTP